jgi:hypothetical protein
MEAAADLPEDSTLRLAPTRPIRILVQTKTHLVKGDDWGWKCLHMRDIICQHHWNRNFDSSQDRWSTRGTHFGYDNRDCYFLVDHGHSANNDDGVPILWYQWTGEALFEILLL